MTPRLAIIISPNWGPYAQKYLVDCWRSLQEQQVAATCHYFLVDNESTAESYAYLQQSAPTATIIRNEHNDGFAKGNNDAMRLALEQGYDYLLLINMDTVSDPHCVQELLNTISTASDIAAVQARLMLWPERQLLNSAGNMTHFLGFGYCRGYRQPYQPGLEWPREIAYPSGAAVLLRATALRTVGLFDEVFWMYNEDQDLGWRLWLAGYRCLWSEAAVVYHKYSFGKSISNYYWMDRNRLLVIFKHYHWATLLLLAPALLVMEAGLLLFACSNGWLRAKLKLYGYFCQPSTWRYLRQARARTQALRQVPDRKIVAMFSGQVLYQEVDSRPLRLANYCFERYWRMARYLIIW